MIYSCPYPTDEDDAQSFYRHVTTSTPSIPALITTTDAAYKRYLDAHVSLEPTTIEAAHVDSRNATSPNRVNSHPTASTPTQARQLPPPQDSVHFHHVGTHPHCDVNQPCRPRC